MSTILDYIAWRGDLSFDVAPFNEIDALICCEFAYLKLQGIVPDEFTKDGIALSQAASAFFAAPDIMERSDMGLLFGEEVVGLFRAMAATRRYGQMRLCGFVERLDEVREKQFAALTLLLEDGSFFVVFRGTDDSLVGWKEDFNMTFMASVPSQKEALDYLVAAASHLPGKIRVGGHSKGGNISIYSAAFCGRKIQKRIISVYNFDGPGFEMDISAMQEFQAIGGRVRTFVPEQSVVGLLMKHDGDYTVVKSQETGLMQHNLLSWQLDGPRFMEVEQVADASAIIDRSVKSWLKNLTVQERERFVEALFTVLASSQATSLSELADNWKRNPAKAMGALLQVDGKTRRMVWKAFQQLFRATHHEIKLDVKLWLQEKFQAGGAADSMSPNQ